VEGRIKSKEIQRDPEMEHNEDLQSTVFPKKEEHLGPVSEGYVPSSRFSLIDFRRVLFSRVGALKEGKGTPGPKQCRGAKR